MSGLCLEIIIRGEHPHLTHHTWLSTRRSPDFVDNIQSYLIFSRDEVTLPVVCPTYSLSPAAYFLINTPDPQYDCGDNRNLKYAPVPVKIIPSCH